MWWRIDMQRFATATAGFAPRASLAVDKGALSLLLSRIVAAFTNPLWRAGRCATPAHDGGAGGPEAGATGRA
jgi:hypothetical protein